MYDEADDYDDVADQPSGADEEPAEGSEREAAEEHADVPEQQKKVPTHIPYGRFNEVNQEKKELANKVNSLNYELARLQGMIEGNRQTQAPKRNRLDEVLEEIEVGIVSKDTFKEALSLALEPLAQEVVKLKGEKESNDLSQKMSAELGFNVTPQMAKTAIAIYQSSGDAVCASYLEDMKKLHGKSSKDINYGNVKAKNGIKPHGTVSGSASYDKELLRLAELRGKEPAVLKKELEKSGYAWW